MSLSHELTPAGHLIHGMTSVGYVEALGLTESQALAKAKDRINELQRKRSTELFEQFRARYPDYFSSRKLA
jgi:hypothetical protein